MKVGITRQELAGLLGVFTPEGWDGEGGPIVRVSAPANADAESLVFAEDEESFREAIGSAGSLILTTPELLTGEGGHQGRFLTVADPRYAFAVIARELRHRHSIQAGSLIHPSAVVDERAVLGERVQIGAGTIVGADARLGDDVVLGSRVVVADGVVLGNRVVVQHGAVLGSTGFGYVRSRHTAEYLLFPQQGTLVIEDDVEIGANTTIDRGALEETRIGRGTKIDNLVHVGHNCRIGQDVVIAAQAGISGSCVIEDGAILAGQVGISDHCHIGTGVILGGQAGVYRGKSVTGKGVIFAGTPAEPLREHMSSLATVRALRRGSVPSSKR